MDGIKNRLMESKAAQTALYSTAIAVPLVWTVWSYMARSKSHGKLPPGPKRYPVVGNMPNFPKSHWYDTFCEWQQVYGSFEFLYILFFIVGSIRSDTWCLMSCLYHLL